MKRKTQRSKIKEHLESGLSITPIDALERYGCFRLAAIIHTLRHEDGMNIEKELIKNKFGTKYGKYSLVLDIKEKDVFIEEEIDKLKLLLQMYGYEDAKIVKPDGIGFDRYVKWKHWSQMLPEDVKNIQINSNIKLKEKYWYDDDQGYLFYYNISYNL
tara:strand:- start:38 stop:511 length:474 start_codon:yes stop_codon:yes gene_type:complete